MITRTMPKEYMKEDMPIAATFLSGIDCPELKLFLGETKMEKETQGEHTRWHRIPNSAIRVEFRRGRLSTKNSLIMGMLLEHDLLGRSSKGFNIDPKDETGLWRKMGMIEVEMVPTTTAFARNKEGGFKKVNVSAIVKASKELEKSMAVDDEKGEKPKLDTLSVAV